MKFAIKRSLIDDYISIVLIINFCNNTFCENLNISKIKNLQLASKSLREIYNKIFEILNLKDNSFLVLEQQLSENNSMFIRLEKENFTNFNEVCETCFHSLSAITGQLRYKLSKLKLNHTPLLAKLEIII